MAPLDVVQEFQGKIMKTAQALQQQLAESAEKPAVDSSTDRVDMQSDTASDADLVLARLSASAKKSG